MRFTSELVADLCSRCSVILRARVCLFECIDEILGDRRVEMGYDVCICIRR